MAVVDVSVTRSLTINTGNYESMRPTVTVTARDIDTTKAGDAFIEVSSAVTNMLKLEVLSAAGQSNDIGTGLTEYCRNIIANVDDIGADEYWAPGVLQQVYMPSLVR